VEWRRRERHDYGMRIAHAPHSWAADYSRQGRKGQKAPTRAPTRVGAQTRDAREYWEGVIVTACDNFMAFLLKLISRYKSII